MTQQQKQNKVTNKPEDIVLCKFKINDSNAIDYLMSNLHYSLINEKSISNAQLLINKINETLGDVDCCITVIDDNKNIKITNFDVNKFGEIADTFKEVLLPATGVIYLPIDSNIGHKESPVSFDIEKSLDHALIKINANTTAMCESNKLLSKTLFDNDAEYKKELLSINSKITSVDNRVSKLENNAVNSSSTKTEVNEEWTTKDYCMVAGGVGIIGGLVYCMFK